MPTVQQYREALPQASPEFILAALEGGLSISEAVDRFREFERREAERAAAELLASETVAVAKIQTRPVDPIKAIFSKNNRRSFYR